MQDAGSQAIVEACAPEEGGRALDACAGNGGKALALAERFQDVLCHDVDVDRLAVLRKRARKAGVAEAVATTDATPLPRGRAFDLVLVDAPCSGSGVLRRLGRTADFAPADSPADADDRAPAAVDAHAARRARRDRAADREAGAALSRLAALQISLLSDHAARSRDRLVYATCSLAREENADVVDAFEASAAFAGYAPWPFDGAALSGVDTHTRTLLPSPHHDGFFIARWRRLDRGGGAAT